MSHPIVFDFCAMDMDLDISRWVLEFLVRKVIDDSSIKQLLPSLPLLDNNSSRLRKTMLLRSIGSEILDGSVSEKILDLLETIAEVDRGQGYVVFETMKSAYCAVAVDCTVRFMEDNANSVGQYFDAVKKIWRGRIANLEKSDTVDLISDQLRSWRDEIEAAIWDDEVCKNILTRNKRNEALKAVRAYVTEAWKVMGPTFLEVVAKEMGTSLMETHKLGEHGRINNQVEERPTSLLNAPRSLGVSNESNVRDKGQAGERALSSPNAQQDLGFSEDCTMEYESQVGDKGRTFSGDVGGSTKTAPINENVVGHIAIPRSNVGGDLGGTDIPAKRVKCQVKMRASSMSDARYELGARSMPSMKDKDQCRDGTSSANQDLGGSAKPANTDEIHVQEIAIPLPNANGDSTDVQAHRNKYQVQERALTSFDATRDMGIGDRPAMKDVGKYRDGVTTFPRHLGGSTEPAIIDGNQVEDIAIALPNVGVELGLSDELTKGDKDQVADSAATSYSASQDLCARERSIMKHKDQCGEVAATYCQDNDGSTKSAIPVENQAEDRAMFRGKLIVTDELYVRDRDHKEEIAVTNLMTRSGPALRDKEVENANVLAKRKHVAGHGKRYRRGIKISDVEELSVETSSNNFDCPPSPEVNKIQEALRSSSLELQGAVKDPLPEALSLANNVLFDMERKHMDVDVPNHSVDGSVEAVQANENDVPYQSSRHQNNDLRPSLIEETHNRMDANPPNSFVNKSPGPFQGNEDNPGNQFSSHQNNEARPTLMARNGTAQSYEWEDSIDCSPEGSRRLGRIHLQTPKRCAVSPLKKYEHAKVARKRKIWSNDEEETLRIGVQKFGRGNWKLILNTYHHIFKERTVVDLKDKWRNLMK